MKARLLILFYCICASMNAQQVFSEKFSNCNVTAFSLETDSIIAKVDNKQLVNLIFESLDAQAWDYIEGYLMLQVIVGLDGGSCLLSLENKTNIPTSQMNLKSVIDSELIWQKPSCITSAILLVVIGKNGVAVKRFGSNGKGGWRILNI
ncbi:MAG: hypothetical protein H6Q14_85 [Bacteroidetes bacterium]|jgi:hypothetical protein|nr:hypothetical protein [Bacteroidota bacterium]